MLLSVNPSVAKTGGYQRQGARGEVLSLYCDPLATPILASFWLSRQGEKMSNDI